MGPWEGEEEGCIPRDFLGYCWDIFPGREGCSIGCLALGWIPLSQALEDPLGHSGEGVKVSSLAWELLLAASAPFPFRGCGAEVCWYVCNAVLRAPSPRWRTFPAQPPLPWLHPSALSDGAGDQGPAGRSKPGAGGGRWEELSCKAAA